MSPALLTHKFNSCDEAHPGFDYDPLRPSLKLSGTAVHSMYDPAKEAQKLAGQIAQMESSHLVIFGLGLGYLVRELIKFDLGKPIYVVEPRNGTLFFLRSDTGLAQDLEAIDFYFSDEFEDLKKALEEAKPAKLCLYANHAYKNTFASEFLGLETFCANHNFKKEVNNNTLQKFGKLWVRNFLRNYELIARTPGIELTKGLFDQMPVLLLAAGPSLDHFLPHLQKLAQNMLICVVDTSLRASLAWGVEPDFCVMMDPQYWNSRHLDGQKTERTFYVSDSSIIPRAIRGLEGRLAICQSIFPLAKLLDPQNEIRGPLAAGGSVATSAWDMMRSLNPKGIWTLGLDLSYPHGETHFKGSYFESQLHNAGTRLRPSMQGFFAYLNDAPLEKALTRDRSEVLTDNRMSLYCRWFESMLGQTTVPNYRFSMGARHIEGFIEANLDELLSLRPIRPLIDAAKETLGQRINQYANLMPKAPSLFTLRSSIDKIIDLSHRAVLASREAKTSSRPDLTRLNKLDEELMKGSDNRIVGFLLEDAIQEISLAQKPRDLVEAINRSESLYSRINLEANYLKKLLLRYSQD